MYKFTEPVHEARVTFADLTRNLPQPVRALTITNLVEHGNVFYLYGIEVDTARVVAMTFAWARDVSQAFPRLLHVKRIGVDTVTDIHCGRQNPDMIIVNYAGRQRLTELWSIYGDAPLAYFGGLETLTDTQLSETYWDMFTDADTSGYAVADAVQYQPIRVAANCSKRIFIWELNAGILEHKTPPTILPCVWCMPKKISEYECTAMYSGILLLTDFEHIQVLDVSGAGQVVYDTAHDKPRLLPNVLMEEDNAMQVDDDNPPSPNSSLACKQPHTLMEFAEAENFLRIRDAARLFWLSPEYLSAISLAAE